MKIARLICLALCIPANAVAQGAGPSLKFVSLEHEVYTFTRGEVVVKASCEYSTAYAPSGKKKEMEHFCPLNQLPGDSIAENGLYAKQEPGDRYSLSNEFVSVTKYQYCTSGERCVDKLRISQEVWFRIISMKKGKAT
jgi:hypothetical protein